MENNGWNFVNEIISEYEGKKEYFATANVKGIDIVKDGILVSYEDKPSRAQKQPVLFSVWFARMKDTYKVLGFTKVNEDIANSSILSSGFAGFKTSEFNFPFIYLTIDSEEFHQKKNQYCTGATQMSLTNDGLQKIKIAVPAKNTIEDFGKVTLPLLNKVFVLQKINKVLRTTRDLLLPKLISGELDISDLEVVVRTANGGNDEKF
jgi:type I restriction enzyme S subunit